MKNNRLITVSQATEAHRENLRKNLQHRIEVARVQGNDKLLEQLQQEAAYLQMK